jgi:hypothetical protein
MHTLSKWQIFLLTPEKAIFPEFRIEISSKCKVASRLLMKLAKETGNSRSFSSENIDKIRIGNDLFIRRNAVTLVAAVITCGSKE